MDKTTKTVNIYIGIVKNNKNEILLVKRNEKELPEVHNHWELPGGKINFGETAEEAIEREFLEETGYTIKANYLLPKSHMNIWNYSNYLQHTIIMCFFCELKNNIQKKVFDHKINDIRWVSYNELSNLKLLPGVKDFINLTIQKS